ncbi:LuxR family transcriptional regulator [Pseudoroseicyclus tamaricis]|uniref:LuxR family transcriptional regulator n=1 Tax=Pseudoroseicyclus tamaricis TaxID=2705421 RepID=A0A6B2JQD6_9RHOB|nr:LuxR family transcriptional regulator [Pseudoroseicyclus tamaricis]NDV00897.1 LuxR family transcriptional regulator [Pseudoroseicyclus tamaricis]
MSQFLLSHLEAITNAPRVEDLWALHTDEMARRGFTRVLYGYTRYRSTNSLGDPQDWVMLTNHAPEYINRFLEDGLFHNAPMTRWALENDGACSWSWLQEMYRTDGLTPAETKVVEFNRKMGVTAGYTLSFRSVSQRTKGAIALTGAPGMSQAEVDRIWEEQGPAIMVANNVFHLKLLTLPWSGNRSLTKRQIEVLQWVGDGKTTQDIALILGLTAATVEKHLRLAREALDVETTAQAVLKAAFYNQMFVLADA